MNKPTGRKRQGVARPARHALRPETVTLELEDLRPRIERISRHMSRRSVANTGHYNHDVLVRAGAKARGDMILLVMDVAADLLDQDPDGDPGAPDLGSVTDEEYIDEVDRSSMRIFRPGAEGEA